MRECADGGAEAPVAARPRRARARRRERSGGGADGDAGRGAGDGRRARLRNSKFGAGAGSHAPRRGGRRGGLDGARPRARSAPRSGGRRAGAGRGPLPDVASMSPYQQARCLTPRRHRGYLRELGAAGRGAAAKAVGGFGRVGRARGQMPRAGGGVRARSRAPAASVSRAALKQLRTMRACEADRGPLARRRGPHLRQLSSKRGPGLQPPAHFGRL